MEGPANAPARSSDARWLLATLPLVFVLTFPAVGMPIQPGLDPSYRYAFNRFFDEGIPVGDRVLFNYGPLAFLMFPAPLGQNLGWAAAVTGLLHLAFTGTALFLGLRCREPGRPGRRLWAFGAALLLVNAATPGQTLLFLPLLALLAYRETERLPWLVGALAVVAVGGLVRGSLGIAGFATAGWFALLELRRSRRPLVLVAAGGPLVVLGLWLLTGGSAGGLFRYLRGVAELSSKYASAMSGGPANDPWLLGGSLACFAAVPLLAGERRTRFLYLLVLPAAWAIWRWSAIRMGHLSSFLEFLILLALATALYAAAVRPRVVIAAAAGLVLFAWNATSIGVVPPGHLGTLEEAVFSFRGATRLWDATLGREARRGELAVASAANLRSLKVDPELAERVRGAPVDVYPNLCSLVAAGRLDWAPRPVFQSYTTYTPWLDAQNAEFLRSEAAPRYVLWHGATQSGLVGLDGRYQLSEDPLTLRALLERYATVGVWGDYALLERSPRPRLGEPVTLGALTTPLGVWVPVPDHGPGYLRLRVRLRRSLTGRLRLAFHKEAPVQLVYGFPDGTTREHRILVDNAASGLWVEPYLRQITVDGSGGSAVERVLLRAAQPSSFRETVELEWELLPPAP